MTHVKAWKKILFLFVRLKISWRNGYKEEHDDGDDVWCVMSCIFARFRSRWRSKQLFRSRYLWCHHQWISRVWVSAFVDCSVSTSNTGYILESAFVYSQNQRAENSVCDFQDHGIYTIFHGIGSSRQRKIQFPTWLTCKSTTIFRSFC